MANGAIAALRQQFPNLPASGTPYWTPAQIQLLQAQSRQGPQGRPLTPDRENHAGRAAQHGAISNANFNNPTLWAPMLYGAGGRINPGGWSSGLFGGSTPSAGGQQPGSAGQPSSGIGLPPPGGQTAGLGQQQLNPAILQQLLTSLGINQNLFNIFGGQGGGQQIGGFGPGGGFGSFTPFGQTGGIQPFTAGGQSGY